MQNKNIIIPIVLVAIVLLAVGGFVLMNKNTTSEVANSTQITENEEVIIPTESTSPTNGTEQTNMEVKIVDIEGGSFYYKPNEIRVKKGQKIKLTLKSMDMMHDLNIDALAVKVPITKSGSTSTVEFTANEIGEFEFYCSVGNHRQMGQVGKLIVE